MKTGICYLGMFWSMEAGLSWFKMVMCWSWSGPGKNQLKASVMLQNIHNSIWLFFFFSTGKLYTFNVSAVCHVTLYTHNNVFKQFVCESFCKKRYCSFFFKERSVRKEVIWIVRRKLRTTGEFCILFICKYYKY